MLDILSTFNNLFAYSFMYILIYVIFPLLLVSVFITFIKKTLI